MPEPRVLFDMRCLLVCLLCLAAAPSAAEVYRWTDADGRVHYGERPPATGAERIELPAAPGGASTTVPDEGERRERQRRLLESYQYERERKAEAEARAAARGRELAAQCERLQQHWRRLNHPGPIYVKGADGERRYLDDAQRVAEQDRLRPAYRRACGTEPR